MNFGVPTSRLEPKCVLGMAAHYKRFRKSCHRCCPLINLLLFFSTCQLPFESLKTQLASDPVLADPDLTGHLS